MLVMVKRMPMLREVHDGMRKGSIFEFRQHHDRFARF
jgi:hypothetical protein